MGKKFLISSSRARVRTLDPDGVLLPLGMQVAVEYAKQWVAASSRNLELEREYSEMASVFLDIRSDIAYATELAGD